jgi:hypothetical protein
MPVINADGVPLLELSNITDFYADGVHRVEVLGDNVRLIFFRWRYSEEGVWQRVAVEYARISPLRSLRNHPDQWANVEVMGPPGSVARLNA